MSVAQGRLAAATLGLAGWGVAALVPALLWLALLCWPAFGSFAYLLPLAVVVAAVAAYVLYQAATGRAWALAGLLAFAVVVPCITLRVRTLGQVGDNPLPVDVQSVLKFATWGAVAAVAAWRWRAWAGLFRDRTMTILALYAILVVLSVSYSINPAYSGASAFGLVAYLAFAALVAAEVPEATLCRVLAAATLAYVALTWVVAVALPDMAFLPPYGEETHYRLQGASEHPNVLAKELAGLAGVILALGSRTAAPRWLMRAVAAACLVTLLASLSRSSMVAVVAGIAAWHLWWNGRWKAAVLGFVALVATVTVGAATGLLPLDTILSGLSRSGQSGEIVTLTGRTDLWAFVWDKIIERPLFGFGFNTTEIIFAQYWWGESDSGIGAHNVFLQSLLTTGLAGTLLLVAFMVALFWRWAQDRWCASRYLPTYFLVLGLAEVDFATYPVALTMMIFLAVAIDAAARLRRADDLTQQERPAAAAQP